MACDRTNRAVGRAASRNGLIGQVNRYLNTLGSWGTYRDVTRLEDIPNRIGQVTAAFFGVSGLSPTGWPRLAGLLGAIMAVQALEQVTGAGVTFGTRLFVRGEPIGKYRGLLLRQSPLTPPLARVFNRLSRGRMPDAQGYYFFEAGRTWHSQTATVQVGDTPKTLTHVRSFSLPYREFYFDRAMTPQTVVDVVKGDRDPDTVPGFIGSVNELENMTPLGGLKRAFFMANWLLLDEGERDERGADFVDYDALLHGGVTRRPAESGPSTSTSRIGPWPSTTTRTSPPRPYGTQYFRSGAGAPLTGDPYERIKDRYHAANGQQYPLLVRGLKLNPITMTKKADAIYYDGALKRWREVVDDEARIALARDVEAGRLKVISDWPDYL